MEKIGTAFRRAVQTFAAAHRVPIVKFGKLDRKAEVMLPYLQRQAATGIPGVAAIGVAQEYQNVFASSERVDRGYTGHQVWFTFHKADRRVTCFYFYLWDKEFGPGFIKICAYFPYPAKVWVNGHEWAKQQARHAGIGFSELSNGFAACDDAAELQAICDRLGPEDIDAFFDRWMAVLPVPLTDADRAAGYWWELSMRQVESSRTIVSTHPAMPGASSKPWWSTTLTSADLTGSRSSSPATHDGGDAHPRPSRPTRRGSRPGTRSGSP